MVAVCSFAAASAQGYALEAPPAPPNSAAGPPHWWHGGTTINPRLLDRTNTSGYVGIVRNAALNVVARSTKIQINACLNSTTSWPNTCTTPAECTIAQWNAFTCPGQASGNLTFYDADYGAQTWAGITNYQYTWYSVSGVPVPKSTHFLQADTIFNTHAGIPNRTANSACHELGHGLGLDHRYDYPAVASCINDTANGGAGDCKTLAVCDYLSNDDINGLNNDLYNHTDAGTTKPPGMTYSRVSESPQMRAAEEAVEKYGNNVPRSIMKRLHMRRFVGTRREATLTTEAFPTPSLDRLVLSALGV